MTNPKADGYNAIRLRAVLIFHQKQTVFDKSKKRSAIFEAVVWKVPKNLDYPDGLKYRVWLSENGTTIFGLDNHKPKGPHLHIGKKEVGYVFRGYDELMKDVRKMLEEEGFVYEN